jgi:hypothetical protein
MQVGCLGQQTYQHVVISLFNCKSKIVHHKLLFPVPVAVALQKNTSPSSAE